MLELSLLSIVVFLPPLSPGRGGLGAATTTGVALGTEILAG